MAANGYRAKQVDRRYNDWHYSLPKFATYMDLDGVEYCGRCWDALALIETTSNPDKPTIVMQRLSQRAGVPAWVVLVPPSSSMPAFDFGTEVRWRQVPGPRRWQVGTLAEWGEFLTLLHAEHLDRDCDRGGVRA